MLTRPDFDPDYLFQALYYKACLAAISSYTAYPDIQNSFMSVVLDEYRRAFIELIKLNISAKELHRQTLSFHHTHLAGIKSHRSCFSCFIRMPEKVLACGHALCDPCIKIFGHRSRLEKNTYALPECVICGVSYQNAVFQFVPPTAGIRVLSIDGGGVRGVVPLMFLNHLDTLLTPMCCSINDCFDFVCGTSAGKTNTHHAVVILTFIRWSGCNRHVLATVECFRVNQALRRDCRQDVRQTEGIASTSIAASGSLCRGWSI